jgi:hypothetical protein
MPIPQQTAISKLDNIFSNFLQAYAVKRLDQLKVVAKVDVLREITFSNKEQYRHMDDRLAELEAWFESNDDLLLRKILNQDIINELKECVDQIGAYSRGESGYSGKQAMPFNRRRAAEVVKTANRFIDRLTGLSDEKAARPAISLVKPPEPDMVIEDFGNSQTAESRDIMDQIKDSVAYQSKMLDYYQQTGQHPFTAIDSLLKTLDKSSDIKSSHLAASMLYFMKLKGYKVAPYVERLRKAGNRKND